MIDALFSSREMMMINHLYHHRTAAFWRIRYNTLTIKHYFLLPQLLLHVYVHVLLSSSITGALFWAYDVLLLVQSDRVLFRTSGDIFHVLGIAGVRSKIEEKWREETVIEESSGSTHLFMLAKKRRERIKV